MGKTMLAKDQALPIHNLSLCFPQIEILISRVSIRLLTNRPFNDRQINNTPSAFKLKKILRHSSLCNNHSETMEK